MSNSSGALENCRTDEWGLDSIRTEATHDNCLFAIIAAFADMHGDAPMSNANAAHMAHLVTDNTGALRKA
jgi:hypothetical protein